MSRSMTESVADKVAETMHQITKSKQHRVMFKKSQLKECCTCGVCGNGCPCGGWFGCQDGCSGCAADQHHSTESCSCTAEIIRSLISLSSDQDSVGMIAEAEELLSIAEQLADDNEIEMLPMIPFESPMPEDMELERLESEEVEDPAQVKWYLTEPPVSSHKIDTALQGVERAFDPHVDSRRSTKVELDLPPAPHSKSQESGMDLEGEGLESDWNPRQWVEKMVGMYDPSVPAPPPMTKDWEKEFKRQQQEKNMDFGDEGQPGGWELTEEMRRKLYPPKPTMTEEERAEREKDTAVERRGTEDYDLLTLAVMKLEDPDVEGELLFEPEPEIPHRRIVDEDFEDETDPYDYEADQHA